MKVCCNPYCELAGVPQDLWCFCKRAASKDGLQARCKLCKVIENSKKSKEQIKFYNDKRPNGNDRSLDQIKKSRLRSSSRYVNLTEEQRKKYSERTPFVVWTRQSKVKARKNKCYYEKVSEGFFNYIKSSCCLVCGNKGNIEPDHIVPWSKAGPHIEKNIQALCGPCNRSKHNFTMQEWKRSLRPRALLLFGGK